MILTQDRQLLDRQLGLIFGRHCHGPMVQDDLGAAGGETRGSESGSAYSSSCKLC